MALTAKFVENCEELELNEELAYLGLFRGFLSNVRNCLHCILNISVCVILTILSLAAPCI